MKSTRGPDLLRLRVEDLTGLFIGYYCSAAGVLTTYFVIG